MGAPNPADPNLLKRHEGKKGPDNVSIIAAYLVTSLDKLAAENPQMKWPDMWGGIKVFELEMQARYLEATLVPTLAPKTIATAQKVPGE